MNYFAVKECVPCQVGAPVMTKEEIDMALKELSPDWEVMDDTYLKRTYKFRNFTEGLAFVNRIGELAEAQGHHPDLHLSWGKVVVELRTWKIGGLHVNDFILAAKIDSL